MSTVHLINFRGTREEKLAHMAHECHLRGWGSQSLMMLAERWKIAINRAEANQLLNAAEHANKSDDIPF